MKKIILSAVLLVLLSGCATTFNGHTIAASEPQEQSSRAPLVEMQNPNAFELWCQALMVNGDNVFSVAMQQSLF